MYEWQSNENRTPATKWQWNLFYSKVIARSVNTFVPLGDETINSSLVERGRSLMDPQSHPLLHFLVQNKPTSTNDFLQVAKMWNSQAEISGLYGGCWSVSQLNLWSLSVTRLAVWEWALSCQMMIPPNSIPRCFNSMARVSTSSATKKRTTPLCSSLLASIFNAGWTYFTLCSPPMQKRNNCVDLCVCS